MFVPALSLDAWLLVALPLAGLLLARGSNDPLSINIRYALLVAPGLFAGAVFWWQQRSQLFAGRRLRRIWTGCVLLSLLLTLASNPNRSLSFLVPDSFVPWVHVSPLQQWRHGRLARQVLAVIPPEASVAANTPLIPVLSHRQVLVRLPAWHQWQDSEGQRHNVDWVAIDTALPVSAPRRLPVINAGSCNSSCSCAIYSARATGKLPVLMVWWCCAAVEDHLQLGDVFLCCWLRRI